MFNNLTIPYAGLLLACLLLMACPLPFILIRYGETIRAKSKYAAATTGLEGAHDEESGPVLGARRSRRSLAAKTTQDEAGEKRKNLALQEDPL